MTISSLFSMLGQNRLVAGLFVALLFAGLSSPHTSAQEVNPLNSDHVTWKMLTPTIEAEPGEKITVKFRADLKSGIKMYTQKRYPDSIFGPTPTELTGGGSKGLKKTGGLRANKAASSGYDENFETDVDYWKGATTFSVTFQVKESATPGSTEDGWVNMYYMTCDANSCKPPLDTKLEFKVKVTEPKTAGDADSAAIRDSIEQAMAALSADSATMADSIAAYNDSIEALAAESSGVDPDSVNGDDAEFLTVNERIEKSKEEGLLSYILLAAGFGLLALVTPCVFPMIPITVSFFTKREQATRALAVRDASVYGLGIIMTFTVLGVIVAAIYGASGVGKIATDPWINLLIAGIFITFALNLFGLFEIRVPGAVLNKLNAKANAGSGITSILLMGLVFSLTSFTCTVPFVGSVLASVGEGGNWFWPIIGMLSFATVFALPFFLLALFPSWLKAMPKSGGWLNSVKVVMGFVEIAAAMKFLSNTDLVWDWGILTREIVLAVWISAALLTALYLLGRYSLPHDTPQEKIGVVRMMFSLGFFAITFLLLTGLFGAPLGEADAFLPPQEYPGKGNTSIIASIAGAGGAAASTGGSAAGHEEDLGDGKVMAEGMVWFKDDYAAALAEAKATGKPIFLDFTGYTCTNCRWMESNVFTRDDVRQLMEQYVLARLYTDRREESNQRNQQMQIDRFKTIDLPYYVVLTPDDKVVAEMPFDRDVDVFKNLLRRGISAAVKQGAAAESEDVAGL